ncbi:MAG: nitrilase-related carbon-nitrogen hydrolase, partial [Pseudomonadota bacterium]
REHRYQAPVPQHDVWDRYLELYGMDAVFPVVETELGRLAAVASEEILYPEISRALALKGAEVIAHSTSEVGSPQLTPKDVAKRARAFENSVYVVSANTAGVADVSIAGRSTDGMSKIVDYNGQVLTEAGYGESIVAGAEIDIESLRRTRRRPGMSNTLSRQRTELFADVYGATSVYPANTLLAPDGSVKYPDRSHFIETQRATIARLIDDDLI